MELASTDAAAERLESADFVRVVAHNDADGISAAGVLCSALASSGVRYHFKSVDDPASVAEYADTGATNLFCDLGAAYLDELPDGSVVVDHHPARGSFDGVHVTPRGYDEAASSSCAAFFVAREMGVEAADVAVAGAVGDDALDDRLTREVIEAGVESGRVEVGTGPRLVGDDAVEALAYSTDPYTEYTGDYDGARGLVDDLGVDSVRDGDDARRLSTAVVLLASKTAADADDVERITGEVYGLPRLAVKDAHSLARYLEACGKTGKAGLGLSLCLCGDADTEGARKTWRAFESGIIEAVENADVEHGDVTVVRIGTSADTGAVADTVSTWMVDTDVLVVDGEGKASLRTGSHADCGDVVAEAASSVGGRGGGHTDRGGATVPASRIAEFVDAVRGRCR